MTAEVHHLRAAGVSVLLAASPEGLPCLLHWGSDLGEVGPTELASYLPLREPGIPHSALDAPRWPSVLPENVSGYTGTPALEGLRVAPSAAWAPRFRAWDWEAEEQAVSLRSVDPEAGLEVHWRVELTPEGLVRVRSELTNLGSDAYVVGAVRSVLPVPAYADELLDLTGRWSRERSPQRHGFQHGTFLRQGRHGRSGHDATLLLMAGETGFDFGRGRVWGVHLAWSGDHATYAERTPEGESLLGGSELLGPGEVVLDEGQGYVTPWLVGVYSDHGMDGLSDRLHPFVRRRSPRSRGPRPVVVNTWEATYFNHEVGRLTELATRAAAVGAERFVLDDGWFHGRRHDRAGLGDWTVDRDVWPDGLHPLVDRVRGLGMDFGLWVEPEMVNVDSELYRNHPDWLLRGRDGLPDEWRGQQVLDLQQPAAYEHVREALLALLAEYDVAFLKWDHNRDLVDVGHAGRPAVHGQTLGLYRLLDELRAAQPSLEIETCASGGGRIDLEILARTDRVWPSDTLDPVERQAIQRWTTLLVPPDLLGCHIGGPVAHTTGRATRLGFRAATALLGHLGIEWDLVAATDAERDELRAWVRLHKELRHLVSEGRWVRPHHPDPAVSVSGVVAADRSEAVYVVAATASLVSQAPTPVTLAGLDPARRYRITVAGQAGPDHPVDLGKPWTTAAGVPGSLLLEAGVRLPVLAPESALVLRLGTATEADLDL